MTQIAGRHKSDKNAEIWSDIAGNFINQDSMRSVNFIALFVGTISGDLWPKSEMFMTLVLTILPHPSFIAPRIQNRRLFELNIFKVDF